MINEIVITITTKIIIVITSIVIIIITSINKLVQKLFILINI